MAQAPAAAALGERSSELVEMPHPAMILQQARLQGRGVTTRLCAEGRTPCFFDVALADASTSELRLAAGTTRDALICATFGSLSIRGFAAGGVDDLLLELRQDQQPLMRFFAPNANAIHIESAFASLGIEIKVELPSFITTPEPKTFRVPEAAFRHPSPRAWTSIATLVGAKGPPFGMVLQSGTISLSSTPTGPAIATLNLGVPSAVSAFQSSNNARFIIHTTELGVVYGWVPRDSLRTPPAGDTGHGHSASHADLVLTPYRIGANLTCSTTVAVYVRAGGRIFLAGSLASNGTIGVVPVDKRYLAIALPSRQLSGVSKQVEPSVRLVEGAELLVRAVDVADCFPGVF